MKIFKILYLLGLSSLAFGAGTQNALTVSSGTYLGVDLYSNADGANRQAIVLGDFTSSDTARVDQITGMRVSLSTSALTTSGAVMVVSTATTLTNTGFNINNTPAVSQSGTWTVQPGNTANTTAWKVDGSAVTQPVSGTFWQATQPVSGSVTVLPGAQNLVVTSTATIPVSLSGNQPVKIADVGNTAVPIVSTNTLATQGALGDNGASATTNRIGALSSVYRSDYPLAANTPGNNAASVVLSTSGLMATVNLPDITLRSYSASTVPFAVSNSTTDISELCGNGSNTVFVTGLRVSCTESTAGVIPLTVVKRSSAYGMSWSTITATNRDSAYTNPVSSAVFFNTGSQTNGTFVGYLDNGQIGCMAAATASPNDIYVNPSNWMTNAVVLRGTSQCLGINTNSTAVSGGKWTVTWDWMELLTP